MLYPAGNEPGRVTREQWLDALNAIEDDAAEAAEIDKMRAEDGWLPEDAHTRLWILEQRLTENRNIVAVYTEG